MQTQCASKRSLVTTDPPTHGWCMAATSTPCTSVVSAECWCVPSGGAWCTLDFFHLAGCFPRFTHNIPPTYSPEVPRFARWHKACIICFHGGKRPMFGWLTMQFKYMLCTPDPPWYLAPLSIHYVGVLSTLKCEIHFEFCLYIYWIKNPPEM